MGRRAALIVTSLLALMGCDDIIAPRVPNGLQPGRPASDHVWSSYALVSHTCVGYGSYCIVYVPNGDGTWSSFSGGYGGYLGATWAPDASKIAVSDWEDILVIALADSQTTNLTNGIGSNYYPAWSPDGSRIAFMSYRDGPPSIYVMRASDGGGVIRLTSGTDAWGKPTWSPDSRRLAFTCGVAYGTADVCVVDADGSGFARLTNTGIDGGPDWSPDGTRIAFVTPRFATGWDGVDIATMDPDGGNVTRISRTSGNYAELDWSPGGTSIAYTVPYCTVFPDYCAGDNGDGDVAFYGMLFVMNADGTGVGGIGIGQTPEWKPGRWDTPPTTDQPPVPRFTYSCPSLACSFDASTSSDDHGISGYRWIFGDGTANGTGVWFPHAYATPGTYRVTLTVTDWDGHTVSVTQDVTTGSDQPPVASITWRCDSSGRTCFFSGGRSTDDYQVVSYAWTLGDGSTATGPFASHLYAADGTYDVMLTVTDNGGQTSSVTERVTVADLLPVPRFSPSCGAARDCTFNSSASSDDYGIVSRTWTFGDGSSATDVIAPTHRYPANGSFDVTLTVRDAAGQINSLTQRVTAVDNAPVARFTYSCTNTTCTFDGRASTDDFGVTSYRWNLGKQGTYWGPLVTLQVRGRVSFAATLTVEDGAGQTNGTTQTVRLR